LERPDTITASAVSAREQISQALADKIRQMETAKDLEHVAEDVLPLLEKFLESPEEKRLRRVRAGIITGLVGLGISLVIFLASLNSHDLIPFIALGLIVHPSLQQRRTCQSPIESSVAHRLPSTRLTSSNRKNLRQSIKLRASWEGAAKA
jgi:hypothetical protein